MTDDDSRDEESLDEAEEELTALMNDYNIDREKALQVKKMMDRDGMSAEEAVEMLEE